MIDDGAWRFETGTGRARPAGEAYGTRGMVASAHPVAAAIGIGVLQQGGNAFDAAIAVAAAEGVALPMSCGLGGDAFVVLWDAKRREMVALNGSGVAGTHATRERYVEQGLKKMPLDGVHSIGVPGAACVYETLWQRYGSVPWADLWAPAIRLAEEGLGITPYVANSLESRAGVLARFPDSAAMYLPGGRSPRAGERWAAPKLARSLRVVAEQGAEAIYRGVLADQMLAYLASQGGPFEADDFACQQAVVYAPPSTNYRGVTVYQTAPPSQGFMMLEQLNLLEGFDLSACEPFGADRIHLLVEAKKLAFEDRLRVAGDPAFVDWPLDELISKEHAGRRRADIDPRRAYRPELVGAEHSGDTSYFAVADGDGNAISFIHSLSAAFGSGVVAGDTGITLNNRVGRGFSLVDGHPNAIAPGRRTMHTLNAYLACRDGQPWLVGGTPGGDQQTQWNVQMVTSIVDNGLGPGQAVAAPRWFSFPGTDPANVDLPMALRVESRVSAEVRRDLEARGHVVETLGPWAGGGAVQLIEVDHEQGILRAASDPRPGGVAIGC
ncbi:MAG: gamma-glutamyltransferase [Chloroflexi bacterium]|nr:gamma-glutamyltransferase [Chloroflexota bacterium]